MQALADSAGPLGFATEPTSPAYEGDGEWWWWWWWWWWWYLGVVVVVVVLVLSGSRGGGAPLRLTYYAYTYPVQAADDVLPLSPREERSPRAPL